MTSFLRNGLLVFACCLSSSFATAAEQPPNVLFIIADDLNNMLGCYGHPLAQTPNIDRLAARGMRFEHAYCAFPLCGPSRNSMLTGLYPNSTGILRNAQIFRQTIPEQLSLPQVFRRAGYFAARLGKLYHYNVPNSVGTDGHDDPASWELEMNPAGVDRTEEHPNIFTLTPNRFGGTLSWYASPKSDEYHTDGMLAAEAEWVLERCAKQLNRPFFLAVGFFRPHTPYVSPQAYFDRFPAASMPVVEGIEEDQQDIPPPGLASAKQEQNKLDYELKQQALQAYLASISFMDAQVGRVTSALERLGLADNTIIVFTSDHGYHMGEHGLWQKMSLFEESARVPLLIVAPRVTTAGTVNTAPISQVDLFPTLANLCQVSAPDNLQGQDLTPLLTDPQQQGRGWALTQVTRSRRSADRSGNETYFGYSLRTTRWRYTEWDGGEAGRELYDHQSDPRELVNLATDPSYQHIVHEQAALLQTAAQTTFPANGVTPKLKPDLWAPMVVDP